MVAGGKAYSLKQPVVKQESKRRISFRENKKL
jgi:hypothetical protein